MNKQDREALKEECRRLHLFGIKCEDIAERLKVTRSFAEGACRGMPYIRNCSGLSINRNRQQENGTINNIRFLESRGYKDVKRVGNSPYYSCVCPVCGKESTFFTPNKNKNCLYSCPHCEHKKSVIVKSIKKEIELCINKAFRDFQRKKRQEEKEQDRIQRRMHKCPVCGTETMNRVYCSEKCRKSAHDANHDVKRRIKLRDAMIDSDITLKRLYKRDKGICHICGGRCDYGDYEVRDGQFVSGRNYPSIDHVVPLAKGGEHSWGNVMLAHHYCNTIKGDRV